ncbi:MULTISPECIES: AAA family ATPase [Idiomarina]|jgi:MoxR-like ATPase|uniref:MoxR family ATPase n=2 Tax=Idiomarina baltica TaxID=190892 RepID=A0A348WQL5_9GAMM|nr:MULTISPECIES: MoxR family ATPase [Idiomarina]MAF74837.1 MoxR family ATPase [Idiomarinaceae bacterium]MEC8924329.1 MoxR family ATPase [Pseudomonadota bacterium]EAQ31190.1 MoxR-like ATPase [Idiomarina baltica OS145]KXS35953.1 MAG: MoxR-like ATPase [Idiomarina sp. T82-3]MBL74507.1 MoxR family ATPase [Idiomarinaceae bacterium]|tara:strand:- start:2002 stop:2958 length:957 start_codon:yes stop_codon:yes gene_type:complete
MAAEQFKQLQAFLDSQVLGQPEFTKNLLIAVLADGHLLVEGPPGLAKTRAVQALAKGIEGDFHRVQFTPDLLPADLTGTDIYRPETGAFDFQQGPLFHNLILADEINRAPAKVQSALLEAMAERQITVGQRSYPLSDLFMVLATQNPLEQEGTYPLPEAQLDRFLMHLNLDYPDADTELKILRLTRGEALDGQAVMPTPLTQRQLFEARNQVMQLFLDEAVEHYLVQLVMATRSPANYDETLASWLTYGASPRATIALERCARANAWLNDRDFVTPDDVREVFFNTLRHRIIISYQAEADGISPDTVLERILELVPSP